MAVPFEAYVTALQQSGLVSQEQLVHALGEYKLRTEGQRPTVPDLASYLIDLKLITPWQNEKLAEGRFKGFFLGKFKLMGHLGHGGMQSVYLAEHLPTNRLVTIRVIPNDGPGGKVRYEVGEYKP